MLSTAWRNRHSTTGWMAVHRCLITACTRLFSSSMLRFTAMAKSGMICSSCGVWVTLSAPGVGETSLRPADELALVEERRHHHAPIARGEEALLDAGAVGIGLEVLDDDGTPLARGPLVDGAGEVGHLLLHGVREDARVLEPVAELEGEHPVALDGGQAQLQLRPAEEGAHLVLQLLEALGGDDGLLVDEVALDGGQHFRLRHLDGAHHREAADHEAVGGQDAHQHRGVGGVRADAPQICLGQGGRLPDHVHVEEAAAGDELEVAVEAGIGILDDGHPRELDAEVDAVDALQDQRVRVEDADLQHERDVRAHAELERAVGTREQPLEARGGVEALQPERQ